MPKILLVEDNEMNRDMLSRRLQKRGYEVSMAMDGRQGVEMARAGGFDLILMDMSLPEIDGWEATRQLRAVPETRAVPIIGLTAHAMAGTARRRSKPAATTTTPSPSSFPGCSRRLKRCSAARSEPRGVGA